MPFFVVVQYQAWPDRRDELLAVIREDFAVSGSRYPGRRFARVFRHHQDPERLLAVEEWQQQAEFEEHATSSAFAEAMAACGPLPTTDTLERLQHFRHMLHAPTALACATICAPSNRVAEVERFICDEQRREVLVADGLVLRAVYRMVGSPGRLLVLHGWRTLDDLRAYFAKIEHDVATSLAPIGVSVEQFTGQIAAEFSWLQA